MRWAPPPPSYYSTGWGNGLSGFARSRALLIAAAKLPPVERIALLLDEDADLYTDLAAILSPLTAEEVDALVARYRDGDKAADLVSLLSLIHAPLGHASWLWLEGLTAGAGFRALGAAFHLLWLSDAGRFDRLLLAREWTWSHEQETCCNHYGSLALAQAALSLPFDQTLAQIAPWLVPHAVVLRGDIACVSAWKIAPVVRGIGV